jgi:multicomponent Na+:H+ antiporter subunit F
MIGVTFAVVVLAVSFIVSGVRMAIGPGDANRAIAADLLFFSVIGLIALLGVLAGSRAVFDLVIVMTFVGFITTLSLARALTNGKR